MFVYVTKFVLVSYQSIFNNYIRLNTNRRVLAGGNSVGQTQGKNVLNDIIKYIDDILLQPTTLYL